MLLLQQRRYASQLKLLIAFAVALPVTLLLFYLMHFMISGTGTGIRTTDSATVIEFVRLDREQEVTLKNRRRPERPRLPQQAPARPASKPDRQERPVTPDLHMTMPALEGIRLQGGPFLGDYSQPGAATAGEAGAGVAGEFSADGDVVPLARVAPQYPRKAAIKGIEGWVKVEFTILEDGSVAEPVVLEAKPGRIFNRAAKKAILHWKFRPKKVDGKPVRRRATQTFSFKLDDR